MAEIVEFELVAKTDGVVDGINKVDKAVKKTRVEVKKTNKELSGFASGGKQVVSALDRVTGGLASKFVAVGKAAKLSGKAMRSALISSGIGIAIAAVGILVEYWDDVSEAIGLSNRELERYQDLLNKNESINTSKRKALEEERKYYETIGADLTKTNKKIAKLEKEITSNLNNRIETQRKILKEAEAMYKANQNAENAEAVTAATILNNQLKAELFRSNREKKEIKQKAQEEAFDKLEKDGNEELKIEKRKTERLKKAAKTKADALERIRKGLIDTEAEERAEKLRLIQQDFDEQIKLAARFYGKNSDKVKELKAAANKAELAQQKVFDDKDTAIQKAKDEKAQERAEKTLASENAISISKKRFAAEEIQDEVLRLEKLKEIDALEAEQEAARLQLIVDNAEAGSEAKMNAEIALNEFLEEARQNNLTNQKNVSAASVEITDLENEAKRKSLEGYAGAISSLSSTIGQETAAGKGLAVASSLINTYTAITGQLSAFSKVAVPGYAIAQAIATGVAGFAAVKKIVAVKVPGGGGGSSQTGSMPNVSTPPAFNIVGASGETQLADAIGSQTQRPARAYVVSNDVTTAQEMDRNIIEGASIG
tara:strand:- start:42 stop:1838 length:1797 start_codon:yes stop_codon:yes gene_type:complete